MDEMFEEVRRRVVAFTSDMETIGVRVIGVHFEGTKVKVVLETKGYKKDTTKGGDGDEQRTDAQR